MVFEEIVSTILEGCGLSLNGAKASQKYQRLRRKFQRAQKCTQREPRLREVARNGPLISGAQCWGAKPATAKSSGPSLPWTSDPDVLAWICYLGDALIDASMHCLPSFMLPWGTTRPIKGHMGEFSGSAFELAALWRQQSAEERFGSLELLMQTLYVRDRHRVTTTVDRADQPVSRVLPKLLGRWIPGRPDNRANCLAKAMMLAAFGRRAGATMLTGTPLVIPSRFRDLARGQAAEALLDQFGKCGLPLWKSRFEGLTEILQAGLDHREDVSFPHYSIAFEISEDRWVLVDGNFGYAAALPGTWNVSRGRKMLRRLSGSAPGLSFYDGDYSLRFKDQIGRCKTLSERIGSLAQAGLAAANKTELALALAESPLLDEVLTFEDFGLRKFDPACGRFRKAVCVLLDNEVKSLVIKGESSGQAGGGESRSNGNTQSLPLDAEGVRLLETIPSDTVREAFITLLYKYGVREIEQIDALYKSAEGRGEIYPPFLQFAAVGPGLAIPTLSQVAIADDCDTGDAIEAVLSQHCFDIHRLTFAAGRHFRKCPNAGPIEALSVDLLRQLPAIPPSARYLLDGIA